jgi:hypothetical protein
MEEGMTDALEGENPGGVAEEQTEAAGNVSSWADEMVNTFLVQRTACSSPHPLVIVLRDLWGGLPTLRIVPPFVLTVVLLFFRTKRMKRRQRQRRKSLRR